MPEALTEATIGGQGLSGVRFAPSPSGSFHIGNLRTAWVSKQIADFFSEPWIIRVEDIDTPRVVPDAWINQKNDLQQLGLIASKTILQSDNYNRHLELFAKARREGRIYPCDCSRKEILDNLAQLARAPHEAPPEYSGHCRRRFEETKAQGVSVTSSELLEGYQPRETLAWRWARDADNTGHHDPIVARTSADGTGFVPGYHWACGIDDADGKYRILVRAWDLAPADPIQREIRLWVDPAVDPIVFHTALVTRANGGRLEKRTQGVTLTEVLSSGISITALLQNFADSIDAGTVFASLKSVDEKSKPIGETIHAISLTDLKL